ncbi:hypothetical protein BCD48_10600 [Pseudofrankia sp. BMG5.36]|nr:hypothetical protein BCD48_10600 [Pseudofrankia sp. BMG5.36]
MRILTPQAPRPPRWTRGRFVACVVGGVVVLVVLLVAIGVAVGGGGDDERDVAASTAGPSGTASPSPTAEPELTGRRYQLGHCYLWDRGGSSTTVDDVSCDRPHLFESVSDDPADLSAEFPATAARPLADDEWSSIYDRYCRTLVEAYLGYPLDPHGRFSILAIVPSVAGWIQGDRKIRCGIGAYAPTPEKPDNDLSAGSAKGADQSRVYPVGTCLAKDTTGTGPVACSTPHQHVAIGDIRFTDPPGAAPPSDAAFAERAGQQCAAVARAFFGPSFQQTSTVNISWFNIAPESWQAGSRSVSCLVSYFTDAGEPRAVTGDARNPVPA